MRTHEHGQGQPQPQGRRPVLPKFGEWNVNDPAAGDGYTVVFTKARDEKKAKGTIGNPPPPPPPAPVNKNMRPSRARNQSYDHRSKKKWTCCFGGSNAVEDRY